MRLYEKAILFLSLILLLGVTNSDEQQNVCQLHVDGTCQQPQHDHVESLDTTKEMTGQDPSIANEYTTSNMPTSTAESFGEPQDIAASDAHQQRFRDMVEYMTEVVYKNESYISVRDACRNQDANCIFWAVEGECDKNPTFMQFKCAPACNSCHLLDFESRCSTIKNDPLRVDIWKPGDLDATFQRIVSQESPYKPIVLSQPGVTNSFTRRDSPWIVLMENFTTPLECETLIQLGYDQKYERSKTVGNGRDPDGTLQHVGDFGGRTSKNAWCLDDCYEHDVAQRVMECMNKLTGIPNANAEYLQLLKYEIGDFYETHHDYIPLLKESLPGPRILTVFLYLNDVEQGGGTRFTDLNITVNVKRGSALIWPSVLNDRPNDKDKRLHHAALVVEQGVKYGANAWYHQRDFKAAHAHNCV
ncbi:hypothetical protein MPSEU_000007400 [Mayamaea pseudoterrestris]|nr:hypothetical protein MPSEU_000007400 [Mayamaea pseudoterrestris]